MRRCRIILLLMIIMVLVSFGCTYNNDNSLYYYDSIHDAIADIQNKCIGSKDSNYNANSVVSVDTRKDMPSICFLKDITTADTVVLNNANINLNGFVFTNNKTTLIKTTGVCCIYGGVLCKSYDSSLFCCAVSVGAGSTCYIENVVLNSNTLCQTNIGIDVYGTLFLTNSSIETATSFSNQQCVTDAIRGSIFSSLYIANSKILATSYFGSVCGVSVGGEGLLLDSNVAAYSNYQSDEERFISYAIGCNNSGALEMRNCNVYGVHSGINSSGSLNINGGTYLGYGHGGIYCAGVNKTFIIVNSVISQAEMPIGYEDINVGCTNGGVYIGGGQHKDNIEVFIDNCVIKADKNSIVLRGTSGETNNALYISNTTINIKHIRVDNNTHRIYLGIGCNFELSHIDIPEVVSYTGVSYANYYCN